MSLNGNPVWNNPRNFAWTHFTPILFNGKQAVVFWMKKT